MKANQALSLIDWFLKNSRDLPWRQNRTPYRVWISEVMLQQTQVKTVLNYFKRWMEAFPSLEKLASASDEVVIYHWRGLGYYTRARNLHNGAKQVISEFQGELPSNYKELLSIKGIGPYTAGAILNFAFQKRAVMIDGNIKRVLARYFAIDQNLSDFSGHKYLTEKIETFLPHDKSALFNEALMELGALVCTPANPNCCRCPINTSCRANLRDETKKYPLKKERKKVIKLIRLVLVIEHKGKIAVYQEKKALMKDLYQFPYIELNGQEDHLDQIERFLKRKVKLNRLQTQKQSFTKYGVTLFPYHIEVGEEISGFELLTREKLKEKAFCSGHNKIKNQIIEFFEFPKA